MLGYHDSGHCIFDIWSPGFRDVVENRAFSPYCKHQQELNDIVKAILDGQTNFTLDDSFVQSDLDYISSKLKEAGIEAELTLN